MNELEQAQRQVLASEIVTLRAEVARLRAASDVSLQIIVHDVARAKAHKAEMAAAVTLLAKCRLFVTYAQFSAGYQDENGKSQSYRSDDVRDEIDAFVAERAAH